MADEKVYDVLIIGGGPAGLTAALYASRSNLTVAVLERGMAGGQAATTFKIENYPGFPEGIGGPDLGQAFERQATSFGAEIIQTEIESLDLRSDPKTVKAYEGEYRGRTVILATGTEPRKLGVKGEEEFRGRGVSYCATCDGAFFRDEAIVVVGGGDAAVEEALFLTRFSKKVSIVHRRDKLRAASVIQERAGTNKKIEFIWDSVVEEIQGEQSVTGVVVRDLKTGGTATVPAAGVFIYVGLTPNTSLLKDQVKLDDHGYVLAGEDTLTSARGVFAAGDVRKKPLRQVVTAVGDGAVAAMMAGKHLEEE
ncbi:MAG TPA: thioredoxin-disulfide reductase [Bacillota bacterium]|jgi:thioredoxin reductase (NADPH)